MQYPIQTNYTAGELSPRLRMRVDFNKYQNGLQLLENYIVLPHGGLNRRPGTRFVKEVKDSTKDVRVIPFEFSTEQAYIIEAGPTYFRFYRDGGRIGQEITGAADDGGGEIRITSAAHGLVNGNTVYIQNVGGVPAATGYWVVKDATTDTFDLTGSTFAGTYTEGGEWIAEVATPYAEADLFDLKYAQSADTLYIVHPTYAPRKLTRTSHVGWKLTEVEFIDGPYLDENFVQGVGVNNSITLTPSSASPGTGVTLTASANLFLTTDVGRMIRMLDGSTWGYCVITGYTSGTAVTVTVKTSLTSTSAKSVWRLGSWCPTTGYPSAVTFFEERLMFGGSSFQPQTVWGSVSSDYEDMTPGAEDDSALSYTLASNTVNTIVWLSSAVGLVIGTAGGEFAMFGGNDSPLTPTNVTVRRQTTHGSLAGASPVTIGNDILFIQRSGRKIRRLRFDAEGGTYQAQDLTLLAEHITDPLIYEMSYQQEPDSLLWIVRNDGVLLSMTYKPEEEVVAFARHPTEGLTESVATIPAPDGGSDQTWLVVARTINSVTKRYIEYLDPALYVDSGLTYSGSATDTFSNAAHLNGKVVAINGAGSAYPKETVVGGAFTIEGPAVTTLQAGLEFIPTFETLSPEVKLPSGASSQGRKKRWVELFVRLFETVGLEINGNILTFRTMADKMNKPVPAFTGDKRVTLVGWDTEGRLTVAQPQPLPSTILGHFGTLDVETTEA